MLSPPKDKDLMPFIINNMDPLNPVGKEQARIVKMPFFFESSSFPLMSEPEPILQEDVDKLTNKIKELKLENTQLWVQLNRTKQGNEDLEDKGKQVKEEFERNKKGLRKAEGKKEWVGGTWSVTIYT